MTLPVSAGYRHSWRTRRLLRSLVVVLCPPQASTLGLVEPVVAHVELTLRTVPATIRTALIAGLGIYDLGAVISYGKRAGNLDPQRATHYCGSWQQGLPAQREFVHSVKALLVLGYFEMPQVQERLGYRPAQWIERVKRRRLATYRDDVIRQRAAVFARDPLPPLRGGAGCAEDAER